MPLESNRTPLVVTTFLAATAWWFTHIVDRSGEAPLITYQVTHQRLEDAKLGQVRRVSVSIQNLSKSQSFNNVVLILSSFDQTGKAQFIGASADLISVPPAPVGGHEISVSDEAAQFTIALLPPLSRFQISVLHRGASEPVLVSGQHMSAPFVLARESWHTFILRHEHKLIAAAFIVWLILIVLHRIWWSRSAKPSVSGRAGENQGHA